MLRRPPELPRSINDRLNRLANTVFTPTKYDAQLSPDYLNFRQRIEVDYASSLPLQMLLYFNLCFFPCWLFSHIFVLPVLTISNSNQHIILMIFAFVFKAIIEIVRLYLGYAGNLGERMPELTAFCLLTIIFQVPLTLFLLLYQIIAMIQICMALILAVEVLCLAFLVFEAIFGILAVRIMVTAQSSRFHYRQFEERLSTYAEVY